MIHNLIGWPYSPFDFPLDQCFLSNYTCNLISWLQFCLTSYHNIVLDQYYRSNYTCNFVGLSHFGHASPHSFALQNSLEKGSLVSQFGPLLLDRSFFSTSKYFLLLTSVVPRVHSSILENTHSYQTPCRLGVPFPCVRLTRKQVGTKGWMFWSFSCVSRSWD